MYMTRSPFHLVSSRPWPITAATGALALTVGLVSWFHLHTSYCLLFGLLIIVVSAAQWWRDVIREATFIGYHNSYVQKVIRLGIVLFIVSEVCFFFGFFWAFFHSRLAPRVELGCVWPPKNIQPLNPFSVPLLNTAVLLASGVSVTWAHRALNEGSHWDAILSLSLTILLGAYFTILQLNEYSDAPFTISDRVYGSTFFVITGFHGAHVIIGTTFLLVCLYRLNNHHFSTTRHFGFEAAAWYWHFVDVVWIFLYLSLYTWGS